MRVAALLAAMLVAGCGKAAPPADMPARTWRFYLTHPDEIEAMQQICHEWSGSNAPAGAEPAVVAANCHAAAFAKSQRQIERQQ